MAAFSATLPKPPSFVTLSTHPDCPIAYKITHLASASSDVKPPIVVVFINGLMLPQALWAVTIDLAKSALSSSSPVTVSALTYDRYGQGASRPQNSPSWQPGSHDAVSAVEELDEFLRTIIPREPHPTSSSAPPPKIIFVSHSIGVPLARLYDIHHPAQVSAHLFLDSNIANTDFSDVYPDPDSPTFDPSATLPPDASVDALIAIREQTQRMFHPNATNTEGLDRSNLASLLPESDTPKLIGPGRPRTAPYLTVVGHDPVAFAEEGFMLNGTPRGLNVKYTQPFWDRYNQGLLKLSDADKVKGVVIAEGSGHFVQRDNPTCVANEIRDLVEKLAIER